jgi:hypothetical protein
MKKFVLNSAFIMLVACGGEIGDSDGGGDGGSDGSADAVIADVVLPDGFDPMNCNAQSITFGGPCNASAEQFCETWTRDRAFGAYGHGICQNSACTLGDYCPSPDMCQCSPILICAPGEVCYSDTPDGSTHCKAACTPSP